MEGYLKKRGANLPVMRERYCVATYEMVAEKEAIVLLRSYRTQNDFATHEDKPLSSHQLKCVGEWHGKGNFHKYPHAFVMETIENKLFHCSAPSEEEKTRWLQLMNEDMIPMNLNTTMANANQSITDSALSAPDNLSEPMDDDIGPPPRPIKPIHATTLNGSTRTLPKPVQQQQSRGEDIDEEEDDEEGLAETSLPAPIAVKAAPPSDHLFRSSVGEESEFRAEPEDWGLYGNEPIASPARTGRYNVNEDPVLLDDELVATTAEGTARTEVFANDSFLFDQASSSTRVFGNVVLKPDHTANVDELEEEILEQVREQKNERKKQKRAMKRARKLEMNRDRFAEMAAARLASLRKDARKSTPMVTYRPRDETWASSSSDSDEFDHGDHSDHSDHSDEYDSDRDGDHQIEEEYLEKAGLEHSHGHVDEDEDEQESDAIRAGKATRNEHDDERQANRTEQSHEEEEEEEEEGEEGVDTTAVSRVEHPLQLAEDEEDADEIVVHEESALKVDDGDELNLFGEEVAPKSASSRPSDVALEEEVEHVTKELEQVTMEESAMPDVPPGKKLKRKTSSRRHTITGDSPQGHRQSQEDTGSELAAPRHSMSIEVVKSLERKSARRLQEQRSFHSDPETEVDKEAEDREARRRRRRAKKKREMEEDARIRQQEEELRRLREEEEAHRIRAWEAEQARRRERKRRKEEEARIRKEEEEAARKRQEEEEARRRREEEEETIRKKERRRERRREKEVRERERKKKDLFDSDDDLKRGSHRHRGAEDGVSVSSSASSDHHKKHERRKSGASQPIDTPSSSSSRSRDPKEDNSPPRSSPVVEKKKTSTRRQYEAKRVSARIQQQFQQHQQQKELHRHRHEKEEPREETVRESTKENDVQRRRRDSSHDSQSQQQQSQQSNSQSYPAVSPQISPHLQSMQQPQYAPQSLMLVPVPTPQQPPQSQPMYNPPMMYANSNGAPMYPGVPPSSMYPGQAVYPGAPAPFNGGMYFGSPGSMPEMVPPSQFYPQSQPSASPASSPASLNQTPMPSYFQQLPVPVPTTSTVGSSGIAEPQYGPELPPASMMMTPPRSSVLGVSSPPPSPPPPPSTSSSAVPSSLLPDLPDLPDVVSF